LKRLRGNRGATPVNFFVYALAWTANRAAIRGLFPEAERGKDKAMADSPEKPEKRDAAKKVAAPDNSPMAQARKRAEQMASSRSKAVSPQQFFQEAWVELKKTTWPNRDVLMKSVTVVLALVVAVAIWVGGLDYLFGKVLTPIFLGK